MCPPLIHTANNHTMSLGFILHSICMRSCGKPMKSFKMSMFDLYASLRGVSELLVIFILACYFTLAQGYCNHAINPD